MKTVARLSLVLGVVLGLAGCSTINTRINEKAPVFYSLDANTRAKIAQGDVGLGYTPDMVYIALGTPDGKRQRISADGTTETWIYRPYADYDPYPMWGWGGGFYGGHYGRHGRYGYTGFYGGGGWPRFHGGRHARDEDTRVTFKNGQVVTIDLPRR